MAKKTSDKTTVALLGEAGLLLGYKRIASSAAAAGETQVPVPEGCDLAPGQYRWDGQAFQPLPKRPRGGDHDAVAIALGLQAIERQLAHTIPGFMLADETIPGFMLPDETRAWCAKITARFAHILSAFDEAEKDSR